MRELLEHLDRTLGNSTSASDSEDHRGQSARHTASLDVGSKAGKSLLHRLVIEVHVAASDQEGGLELLLQQVLSDASEEVKSASNSSIPAESDESRRHLVSIDLGGADALEVDEADVELQEFVQESHVVILGFNRVGKEEVSLVGHQVLYRDFFYAKDNRSFR